MSSIRTIGLNGTLYIAAEVPTETVPLPRTLPGAPAVVSYSRSRTVTVTGDGAFGFSAMEIDTAVRHGAPVMIVVSNNGAWAIEVRDQMDRFGKAVGTELQVADYAAMARAFGLKAWRIEGEAALAPSLDAAFAALADGHAVLIDAVTSPEARSSDSKTGLAWVPDLQALAAWDDAERRWLEG